mgnify:CR=1 FL=1
MFAKYKTYRMDVYPTRRSSSFPQRTYDFTKKNMKPAFFRTPVHCVKIANDGLVYVCDRINDRIQIFSPDGEYLSEWTDTQRPTHLVFDAEGHTALPRAVLCV